MPEEREQPVVVRAQGRADGRELPVVGLPPWHGAPHPGVGVRWSEDGALLAVTTWGSSSLPTVPRTGRLDGDDVVLTLGPRDPDVMIATADVTPYTTLIEPPAGLDPHTPTRVHVGDEVVELPPAGTPPPPPVQLRPAPVRPLQPQELRRFEGTPTWDTEEEMPPGTAGP